MEDHDQMMMMGPVDPVIACGKSPAVETWHQAVLNAYPVERTMTSFSPQCYILQILPFDVRNWTSILLLTPKMIVSNRPDDHHAKH